MSKPRQNWLDTLLWTWGHHAAWVREQWIERSEYAGVDLSTEVHLPFGPRVPHMPDTPRAYRLINPIVERIHEGGDRITKECMSALYHRYSSHPDDHGLTPNRYSARVAEGRRQLGAVLRAQNEEE